MKYETIIGLEIHAQLLTESKMFCSCSTKFGAKPNTNICPICTGQPGVLPVTNKKAIELAIKTALALNCKIEPHSVFARKHYFYPDLPKNFQISQYELPLTTKGYIEIEIDGKIRKIGITRVHLEEDAGKLVHKGAARIMGAEESLVDYNRTGVPLMEIVSEPDIRSPKEAAIYTETLANLLRYLGVCDAKMEEGSLRCDANLSIRPVGETKFGVKTEVKNMNSFKAIEKALIAEEKRHLEVTKEGGKIVQETRFYDDIAETTTGMRSKEYAHDYRYFPEPDLVPVEPDKAWVERIKASIGELPSEIRTRYERLGLSKSDAADLTIMKSISNYADECFEQDKNLAKDITNWIRGELFLHYGLYGLNKTKKNEEPEDFDVYYLNKFPPEILIKLISLYKSGIINIRTAKDKVFPEVIKTNKSIEEIVESLGLTQISDESELLKIVQEVIKNNPKQVEEYKAGKETVIMFLVGQVMKASRGKANPELTSKILIRVLEVSI